MSGNVTDLVLLSRSMPPDTGGYQRQFSMLVSTFSATGTKTTWVGVVRDRPTGSTARSQPPCAELALPGHRVPRALRSLLDPVAVLLAGLVASRKLLQRKEVSVIVLSPGMRGVGVLARFLAVLGVGLTARYPTGGDQTHPRGHAVGMLPTVRAVVPSAAQTKEQTDFPVIWIPNAVPSLPSVPKVPEVVLAGRLIKRKRIDWALDAWLAIQADFDEWNLVIVGDGGSERDSSEADLRARLGETGFERARWVGRVDDAVPYIARASVLVFPSDREGLPNVMLEALASRTPVLADPNRSAEWFGRGVPLLPWSGERAELASALATAMSDEELRRRVADAGLEFVRSHHDPDRIAAQWLEPGFVRAGWARKPVPVRSGGTVLDLGSGRFPNPAADVLCERSPVREQGLAVIDRPFVVADAEHLPFRSQAFDLVIASHLIEHVDSPAAVLGEMSRVARSGYIETPSRRFERLLPETGHRWAMTSRRGSLIQRPNMWASRAERLPYRLLAKAYYSRGGSSNNRRRLTKLPGLFSGAAKLLRGALNRTNISTLSYSFDECRPARVSVE